MTKKHTPTGLPYREDPDNSPDHPGDNLLTEVLALAAKCIKDHGDSIAVDVSGFAAALSSVFSVEELSDNALILRRRH